jgi:hypothetical protein
MAEERTTIIDGHSVYVKPLFGEAATLVFYQVQKCLAPALIKAMGALQGVFSAGTTKDDNGKTVFSLGALLASGVDIDFDGLSKAMDVIHDKMTAQEWLNFIRASLASTMVDNRAVGDKVHFDEVFSGKILLQYKVLMFTLEVNFGDFFGMVGFGNSKEKESQTPTK